MIVICSKGKSVIVKSLYNETPGSFDNGTIQGSINAFMLAQTNAYT